MNNWGWYRVLNWSDIIMQIPIAVVRYGNTDDQFDAITANTYDALATFVGDDAGAIADVVNRSIDYIRSLPALERQTHYGSGHGTFHWREPMGTRLDADMEHFRDFLVFAEGRPKDRWHQQDESQASEPRAVAGQEGVGDDSGSIGG